MDSSLIGLKIKAAVGQQVYLISVIFILSIMLSALLLRRAARPLKVLEQYIVSLHATASGGAQPSEARFEALHNRRDEIGALARAVRALANDKPSSGRG